MLGWIVLTALVSTVLVVQIVFSSWMDSCVSTAPLQMYTVMTVTGDWRSRSVKIYLKVTAIVWRLFIIECQIVLE